MGKLLDKNKNVIAIFNDGKIKIPDNMWGEDIAEYNKFENGLRVVSDINTMKVYGYVDAYGCFFDMYMKKLGRINTYNHNITDDIGHLNYSDGILASYDGDDMVGAAAATIIFFDKLNKLDVKNKNSNDLEKNTTTNFTIGDWFAEKVFGPMFFYTWIEIFCKIDQKIRRKDMFFAFMHTVILLALLPLNKILYENMFFNTSAINDTTLLLLAIITCLLVFVSMIKHFRIAIYTYNTCEIFKYGVGEIVCSIFRFYGVFLELYGVVHLYTLFRYIFGNA